MGSLHERTRSVRCRLIPVEDYPEQIGEQLRKARENGGLTVEDVQFRTRIPHSVIEALEAGDFSVFSSPAYAKSFLSQYSEFVGVDARMWLDALVPASFAAGEFIQPDWMRREELREWEEPAKEQAAGGGRWLSSLSLLVLSGGLVFAAYQGYQMLEKRFGHEAGSIEDGEMKAATSVGTSPLEPELRVDPPGPLETSLATEPRPLVPAGEAPESAPRAVIVR